MNGQNLHKSAFRLHKTCGTAQRFKLQGMQVFLPDQKMIKICSVTVPLYADSCETPGALSVCMENPVIPGRIQVERFIPVEIFPEKK